MQQSVSVFVCLDCIVLCVLLFFWNIFVCNSFGMINSFWNNAALEKKNVNKVCKGTIAKRGKKRLTKVCL